MEQITYEKIEEANKKMTAVDIKGKLYMEVNQRIKAFRMVYPTGFIITDMISNENGVVIFNAQVGYYENEKNENTVSDAHILGTGTAYEKENSSFINKTSYIENCETSAVGRALGMAGFGIDTSVASAEEVQNAINNQEIKLASKKQTDYIKTLGIDLVAMCEYYGINDISELTIEQASEIIKKKGNK